MKISYIKLFTLALIFLSIVLVLLFGMRFMNNSTDFFMDEHLNIPLKRQISSVQDGLPYAFERAKKWKKDLCLSNVIVLFDEKDRIEKRKGEIIYAFFTKNPNSTEFPFLVCFVELDMKRQEITRFRVIGSKNINITPLKTASWKIDINQALKIVESDLPARDYMHNPNAKIVIRTFEKVWIVRIESNYLKHENQVELYIDPINGDILKKKVY